MGFFKKRSKDSWSIIVYQGRGNDGKPKYKWSTVHGTKKAAKEALARMEVAKADGHLDHTDNLSVGQYLDKWLAESSAIRVSQMTLWRYTDIVNRLLKPAFGSIPLKKLKPHIVQAQYTKWLEAGYSPQTVTHHHRVFFTAVAQARKWEIIDRNPLELVDSPRIPTRAPVRLQPEDGAKMLEALRSTRMFIPALLAMTCGLRRGEVLGLRWADVNFDNETLSIVQTLEQVGRDKPRFKQPKSLRSVRNILMPPMTVSALKSWKATLAAEKMELGSRYNRHDLVVCKTDGTLYNPIYFDVKFRQILDNLRLPKVRFHDLRHAHITWLAQANVHPKVAQERAGHATIATTMNTYTHVLPGMQQKAADAIEKALNKPA